MDMQASENPSSNIPFAQKNVPPAWAKGLLLTTALAAEAWWLGQRFPLVGGPVFGMLTGLLLRLVWSPGAAYRPGITLCSKQVLQSAVVLLGAGLSLQQVVATGSHSLAVMLTTLVVCLLAAFVLGRALKIDPNITTMIGVGTSICGASAIAAVAPIIEAKEEEVAYAISTIFLFNVAAALLFPILGRAMGLSDAAFGLWAGTAVNDTSSVVGAGYAYSQAAGQYATVVKLARTTLILPVALGLASYRAYAAKAGGGIAAKVRIGRLIPWFIPGFLAASLLNTLHVFPAAVLPWLSAVGKFMIIMAMTAVGLSANLREMVREGGKPLLLGLLLWATVSITSLLVQGITGQL